MKGGATMKQKNTVYLMTNVSLLTALLCVISPITVPIGAVPLSLSTFMIYLFAYVAKTKVAIFAVLLYVLIGAVGLPVFSGYTGGVEKLVGPTGGFIIGYIFLVIFVCLFVNRFDEKRVFHFVGMVIGTAVLYSLGVGWYCFQTKQSVWSAVIACVLPFLLGDAVKIGLSLYVGPILKNRIDKK